MENPNYENIKHHFSRTVAKQYGINAAIIFGYLSYKINRSKNQRDNKVWFYATIDEIAEAVPYLKRNAVYDAVKRLQSKPKPNRDGLWNDDGDSDEAGLLVTGNYNKKGYDRTTWYAFRTKATSKMAERQVVYFRVQEACLLDVEKAVLLENIRYWIEDNKKSNPGYCMHPMSPTELARVLPFSKSTIQRKLKELVDTDGELVSVTPLDGREPAKYGFPGEVKIVQDIDIVKPKQSGNPNKMASQPPQNQIGTFGTSKADMEESKPTLVDSKPYAGGSKPNDYTTLEIPLEKPFEKPLENLLEAPEPLVPRGSGISQLTPPTVQESADIGALLADFKAYVQSTKAAQCSSAPVPASTPPQN